MVPLPLLDTLSRLRVGDSLWFRLVRDGAGPAPLVLTRWEQDLGQSSFDQLVPEQGEGQAVQGSGAVLLSGRVELRASGLDADALDGLRTWILREQEPALGALAGLVGVDPRRPDGPRLRLGPLPLRPRPAPGSVEHAARVLACLEPGAAARLLVTAGHLVLLGTARDPDGASFLGTARSVLARLGTAPAARGAVIELDGRLVVSFEDAPERGRDLLARAVSVHADAYPVLWRLTGAPCVSEAPGGLLATPPADRRDHSEAASRLQALARAGRAAHWGFVGAADPVFVVEASGAERDSVLEGLGAPDAPRGRLRVADGRARIQVERTAPGIAALLRGFGWARRDRWPGLAPLASADVREGGR